MKVECPYKDWEGEQIFLALHLKEIHEIDTNPEPGSINNPIQLNPKKKQSKPDFFKDNLGANIGSLTFWFVIFASFILGVIFANSV